MRYLISIVVALRLVWAPIVSGDEVRVHVLDVGPGLACIVEIPGDNGQHYMMYDTGHWNSDDAVLNAVTDVIEEGSAIELLVLSHSDADHLGATDEICARYRVKRVLRTGMTRTTKTWREADDAIRREVETDGAMDINLSRVEFPPGATYRFGDALVTMVFGLGRVPQTWRSALSESEERNAISIVVRLVYDGKSVLFPGDTVGRGIGDPAETCIAAEREMVENAVAIPIDSDILIAPHHGADNGSSSCFIEAVSPEWVIFPAGHSHEHPRASTAERYLAAGVDIDNIFRTDRGDNEGPPEWEHLSGNTKDRRGDDTVLIRLIKGDDKPVVAYVRP